MKDTLPGYESTLSWGMFFAPGKTPAAVVDRLNAAIHAAILDPDVARIMQRDGYFPDSRNAAETGTFFRQEVERTGVMVKAAKIEPN
jgi:tripartite-type tricarboxylate transporter receptor subunit TctC